MRLSDLRVPLHLPALIKRQGARLLKQTGWKPDLPDVMHKSTEVGQLLRLRAQFHPSCDVSRIDRHSARVTSRVAIPRVKSRDQSLCEGEVGCLKPLIREPKVGRKSTLLLVHQEPPLGEQRRHEEERQSPR